MNSYFIFYNKKVAFHRKFVHVQLAVVRIGGCRQYAAGKSFDLCIEECGKLSAGQWLAPAIGLDQGKGVHLGEFAEQVAHTFIVKRRWNWSDFGIFMVATVVCDPMAELAGLPSLAEILHYQEFIARIGRLFLWSMRTG